MFRRACIGIVALGVCAVGLGAAAQDEDIDGVKAQIAERLAALETYSADTTTQLNMGAITFIVRGAMRGKGALVETTSGIDLFGQKLTHRTVVDAQGIRWEESDEMGARSVTRTSAPADYAGDPIGLGLGSVFGAESVNPRTLLDDLAETYDLEVLARETVDGAEVFVLGGSFHAEKRDEMSAQMDAMRDVEFVGGFVEGLMNSVMRVRARIGVADGFPRSLELLREDGTPTLSQTFSNVQINAPMDDNVFVYTPPDGVAVEDLDVVTATSTVHVGEPAPVFEVIALDGSDLALEEYKGKVVLLDFWATWCGPCIAELPGVIALYNEYHPQGLELIGVSLDGDRSKVVAFMVENPGMIWPQIFDGNAWESEVATLYGVEAIPLTVLIAKDGTIRALDVHGDALEKAVAEALAE